MAARAVTDTTGAPFCPGGEAPGVVASVERIDAWLAAAQPRDVFIYASRMSLPVKSAGAARMRDLEQRGYVYLTCPRSTLDRQLFNYTATRSSLRLTGAKPAGRILLSPASVAPLDDEMTIVNALLPLIERAAHFGRPCPTNKQLAERARLDEQQVIAGLAAMRAAHLIHVHAAPGPTGRRVTIVATGAITGLAA